MSPEQTIEKYRLIRILRIVMGLTDERMEWICGRGWKQLDKVYLEQLDKYVQIQINRLYNSFGDKDEGAVEFLEELMTKIYEAHGEAVNELRKILKKPMKSSEVRSKMKELGYSQRDANRAARDLHVTREYRSKKNGGSTMWWSLPSED